jgi:MoxR-like ATPase
MSYVARASIAQALERLHGTAGHFLKIWLVLKHMGLAPDHPPIVIDTANSTPSLKQLFGFGDPGNRFFIPFAHTPRWAVMEHDASRSIIDTNIIRWAKSASVVTCDPTRYLVMTTQEDSKALVSCANAYPLGLGRGLDGFALADGQSLAVPLGAFAVWYGRQSPIPPGVDPLTHLINQLIADLHLSPEERDLVFADDALTVQLAPHPVTDAELLSLCAPYLAGAVPVATDIFEETDSAYLRRVRSMSPQIDLPAWLRADPDRDLAALLASGARAILLYGAPRTGKTRCVDALKSRTDPQRATIQIHDGWTYDHLIEGFVPDQDGAWHWEPGALKKAIAQDGKTFIVLEEINRTLFTQALGEVFSLIEPAYRGEGNALTLRSGASFFIPEEVVIVMTMNTVDRSTEDVDDALLGRIAAVEFPPSPTSLVTMLTLNEVPEPDRRKLAQLHAAILEIYPLGHGYFADLHGSPSATAILHYYKTRIRPVLAISLGPSRANELQPIDNLVNEAYNQP